MSLKFVNLFTTFKRFRISKEIHRFHKYFYASTFLQKDSYQRFCRHPTNTVPFRLQPETQTTAIQVNPICIQIRRFRCVFAAAAEFRQRMGSDQFRIGRNGIRPLVGPDLKR